MNDEHERDSDSKYMSESDTESEYESEFESAEKSTEEKTKNSTKDDLKTTDSSSHLSSESKEEVKSSGKTFLGKLVSAVVSAIKALSANPLFAAIQRFISPSKGQDPSPPTSDSLKTEAPESPRKAKRPWRKGGPSELEKRASKTIDKTHKLVEVGSKIGSKPKEASNKHVDNHEKIASKGMKAS